MGHLNISISAEKIFSILGLPITNSILTTWLVMIVLTLFAVFATKKITLIPSYLQSFAEFIIDTLYNLFSGIVGETVIDKIFPVLATIFLFIIVSNWMGLFPGFGSIGINETVTKTTQEVNQEAAITPAEQPKTEFVPLFRGATSDLNTTLAISLIAMTLIQYYGIKTLGLTYLKKFFNFSSPINFYVGILEFISEISRIISFSFRLFGNIFAGEVLLTVVAFLVPLIAPLPFLGLELFVGFIQALVFAMLTAVFLKMAIVKQAH